MSADRIFSEWENPESPEMDAETIWMQLHTRDIERLEGEYMSDQERQQQAEGEWRHVADRYYPRLSVPEAENNSWARMLKMVVRDTHPTPRRFIGRPLGWLANRLYRVAYRQ